MPESCSDKMNAALKAFVMRDIYNDNNYLVCDFGDRSGRSICIIVTDGKPNYFDCKD